MDSPQLQLRTEDLQVKYGDYTALNIPQLEVRGNIIAIIGHNGSGKSTLIKTILSLLEPHRGKIEARFVNRINDSLSKPLQAETSMAFSPENGSVFGDIPVEDYIKLWCRIKRGKADYYKKDPSRLVERLDVVPLLRKLGRELSKGQRRRVQTAVGFLTGPQLFLFDEPFDGLDVQQSNNLLSFMLDEASNMAMIVSSHRMEMVERIARTVVVLNKGEVISSGPIDQVCTDLCRHSILVSNGDSTGEHIGTVLPELRRRYEECMVTQLGSQISITGNKVDTESIIGFFKAQQFFDVKLSLARPSLVDAMNYHLKN
jgi:ABC-type multidrug transport system ATPase subunit